MGNAVLSEEEVKWVFQTIRKIDFLATVPMEGIEQLVFKLVKETYPAHKHLIMPGMHGNGLYIIKSGSCKVYIKKAFFVKKTLAVLKEGEFFGEMSLVLGERSETYVVTLEPTTVFILLRTDFLHLMKSNENMEVEIKRLAERRKIENYYR